MNGYKLTGVGVATNRTDAASIANIQDGTGVYVSSVGGTANAITLTVSPAISAYALGQTFRFISIAANTGAATVAISGLAAKNIIRAGSEALSAGDIPVAGLVQLTYDGTQFLLQASTIENMFQVKGFGAKGDAVTDDQTALVAAVAAAYAAGDTLYWPDGTYVTTATIPNFHDVRHRGPGVVQRGSDLFYPDPSLKPGVTNILYVATTGVDTNDGLSSSQPRLTAQATGNLIYKYSYGDVTWKIQFAAGTYSITQISFSKAFPTPNRVQFLGPSVGAGVQPTVIMQAATPMTDTIGLYFQNHVRVQISDINFRNFRVGASPSSNTLGLGLTVDGRCELYTTNVWTDDCDQGIYATNGCQIRVQAGRHGFNAINGACIQLIRHCQGSIGYNGSAADVNGVTGTAFIGGQRGVILQEFSMTHTDYCYYSAQTFSGVLANSSRIHSVSSTYDTCLVGIDARMGSNLGDTSNTFTGCTTDVIAYSRSTLAGTRFSEATNVSPPTRLIDGLGASTQSATPVTILTNAFEAKEFAVRGRGFKWTGYFDVLGTADTKTVVVTLGVTVLLNAVIAASTTNYTLEVAFINTTAASAQKSFATVTQNGVLPVTVWVPVAENTNNALTLTVTHQVANVADRNDFNWGELEITH